MCCAIDTLEGATENGSDNPNPIMQHDNNTDHRGMAIAVNIPAQLGPVACPVGLGRCCFVLCTHFPLRSPPKRAVFCGCLHRPAHDKYNDKR